MLGRDMTQGSVWKLLLAFGLPLFFAALLQQTYNAFDAFVMGRFVSQSALAAVGSSGPITMLIVSFFMGMSSGSSVLIAQFFGAKDVEGLKQTVHTAILLSILVGGTLSVIGVLATPLLLRMIQTPPEVFDEAVLYLRIIFGGLMGLTVYNMGAAVLTATGDSKRPLYFLALSTIVKVALSLLLVLRYDLGVAGVALATVVAQIICAVLVIALLCRHPSHVRLHFSKLRIHGPVLRRILKIGLPGGIQGAIISFSNVFVQSYINRLGYHAMAGYGVGQRIDGFITMPMQAMNIAVSTFVGQNLGSLQVKRARAGARAAIIMGTASVAVLSAVALTFATPLLSIFTTDTTVIGYGRQFMSIFVPMYFLLSINHITAGALRGAGDVKIPTIITVICFVALRQTYLFIVTQFTHTVTSVALGFPLGWLLAAIFVFICYKRSDWVAYANKIAK